MDFMNLNQAAHGDREFGFIQSRLGVPRKTVAGHVDSPSVARRVGEWSRAALGAAELRSLRLARFGDNMRDVAVTEGDKVAGAEPPSASRSTPTPSTTWSPRSTASERARRRRAGRRVRRPLRRGRRAVARR